MEQLEEIFEVVQDFGVWKKVRSDGYYGSSHSNLGGSK